MFGNQRDLTVDVLRGLAIFVMIGANMAPLLKRPDVPFWFRYYASLAAPLFILISGMMVTLTIETSHHDVKYFFVRGVLIIAVGVLVDVLLWKILPFTTVDVLYLIGLSLPLAALSLHLESKTRWGVVILIFLLTPLLQNVLGYSEYPTEIYLPEKLTSIPLQPISILNHWIVDGWFPIFPWLGFSLLGANLAGLRRKWKGFGKKVFLVAGVGITAVGILAWWLNPGPFMARAGYFELFYPPTLGFIMTVLGTILVLFYIVDKGPSVFVYNPFRALGESSLFIYVLHLVVIEYLIGPYYSVQDFKAYMVLYGGLACTIILIAYGLRVLKTKWKNRPFVIRFLLGS